GIDYGSSNSAVALAYEDGVEVVGESRDDALAPSTLYLHRDSRRVAGNRASELFFRTGHQRTICANCSLARYGVSDCRQFRRAGSCNDSRLLWSVKRDLANLGYAGTNSWATDFPVIDLVAVTLHLLRRRAERACDEEVTRVVLGHPVVFAGAAGDPDSKANQTGRERLREAAALAGFTDVVLCAEPEAAGLAGDGTSGSVLLADFGAGTYDVAVLDRRPGAPLDVRALVGVDIGGSRFDEVLFETVVAPELGLHELPSWLFNDLKSLSGVMLLMADPDLSSLLERIGGPAARAVAAILYSGDAYGFYKAIEATKIALSEQDSAELVSAVPGVSLRATVTRTHFETAVGPELEALEAVTRQALDAAELQPDDVDVVAVTGGSSQIPAFQRLLHALCPRAELRREAAFTSVVRGLGTRARALWTERP
ncbi:MAG TPA: Hsp70 family protein, partial [Candidatus Dormibacteraeota bacterium]|nr:Hsp70 family protein [Candidatus Dormibacteraeota bacterium]